MNLAKLIRPARPTHRDAWKETPQKMVLMTNPSCDLRGIPVPRLEAVRTHLRATRSIAIFLLLVTAPLSGCFSALAMTHIGTRVERVQRFERAVRKDDQLVIDYQAILVKQPFLGAEQVITPDAQRWTTLDLRTYAG